MSSFVVTRTQPGHTFFKGGKHNLLHAHEIALHAVCCSIDHRIIQLLLIQYFGHPGTSWSHKVPLSLQQSVADC
jgi:hypothetical protein